MEDFFTNFEEYPRTVLLFRDQSHLGLTAEILSMSRRKQNIFEEEKLSRKQTWLLPSRIVWVDTVPQPCGPKYTGGSL